MFMIKMVFVVEFKILVINKEIGCVFFFVNLFSYL